MRFIKKSDEVVYAPKGIVELNNNDISTLVELAKNNSRRRMRVCTHESEQSLLHEMIIVMGEKNYIRPHKHARKVESYHVIHGTALLLTFNSTGRLDRVVKLSAEEPDASFYCRVPCDVFHAFLFCTEWVIFHESTLGPFSRGDCEFAEWAPDENDEQNIAVYLRELRRSVSYEEIIVSKNVSVAEEHL